MQKPIGSPKMRTTQCIPRLMKTNKYKTSKPLVSPMTLLERFREAVLRFIMLSAVSNRSTANQNRPTDYVQQCTYSPYDPHHSEAVADCIEFIKKKASPDDDDNQRSSGSSASSCNTDAAVDLDVIIPVLVNYVTYVNESQ